MGTGIEQGTSEGIGDVMPRGPRATSRQSDGAATRRRTAGAQQRQDGRGEGLANALGWFSIGLGLAQVAAPGRVADLIGVEDDARNRTLMRALGIRELTSGVGILTRQRPAGWVWARVAGDVMDLALLGTAMGSSKAQRNRTIAAAAAVLGVAALDVVAGQRLGAPQLTGSASPERAQRTKRSITVMRQPEEVYAFWRDVQNFPRFMRHLESVQDMGNGRSHWVALGPGGVTVEWDAEITDDQPNELIAWRSLPGAQVWNAGTVRFRRAPGGRGTEIHLDLQYAPPGGAVGATVAKLFHRAPGQMAQDDIYALKQIMETGEVLVSDATVDYGHPHPGQPPAHAVQR